MNSNNSNCRRRPPGHTRPRILSPRRRSLREDRTLLCVNNFIRLTDTVEHAGARWPAMGPRFAQPLTDTVWCWTRQAICSALSYLSSCKAVSLLNKSATRCFSAFKSSGGKVRSRCVLRSINNTCTSFSVRAMKYQLHIFAPLAPCKAVTVF